MNGIIALTEKSFFFWFSVVFLRSVLDISYVTFVSPLYGYSGFYLDVSIIKYVESIVLMLFFCVITPRFLNRPSDYLIITMLYAFIIPILSYYALSNQSRFHLYLSLICVSLVYLFSKGRSFKLPEVKYGIRTSILVCFVLTLITTIWFFYSSGFRYFNLNFNLVYDYRGAVSNASYVGLMAYIITWSTKVIGPVLMGYAICYRRFGLAFFILSVHVLWFGFSSHKSVLFYPFLIIGLWFWFQKSKSLSPLIFISAIILLLSFLSYLVFDELLYASLFIRRVFFVVAQNTFLYFDFFSENQKVFWSNSFLSGIVEYPYHIGPAKLMGFIQDKESHVNNSFVSTGYMHAGVFGILLYGVLAGLLFRLIDSLANNYLQVLLVLSSILIPSRAMILSADLPTALLTHGIAIAILLAFLSRYSIGKASS